MATQKTKPAVKKPAAGKKVAGKPAIPKKQATAQKISKTGAPKSLEGQRAVQVAVPARKKTGPPPVAQDKLTAVGLEAICNEIIEGTTYRQMAVKYGVGLATLALWMEAIPERSRACAKAREISAQTCDEKALQGISDAKDKFELDKAKEEAIHLRWRAKSVNPKRYGDKVAVGGADDLPPVQSAVHTMTTEMLLAIASGKTT